MLFKNLLRLSCAYLLAIEPCLVQANPEAVIYGCIKALVDPVEPVSYTFKHQNIQCMYEQGSEDSPFNLTVDKAGVSCIKIGKIEAQSSGGCWFQKSLWNLGYTSTDPGGSFSPSSNTAETRWTYTLGNSDLFTYGPSGAEIPHVCAVNQDKEDDFFCNHHSEHWSGSVSPQDIRIVFDVNLVPIVYQSDLLKTKYDMIVAMSQKSINRALQTYVKSIGNNTFSFFYGYDRKTKTYIPVEESKALYIFSGTMTYLNQTKSFDDDGNPIYNNPVSLFEPSSPQKILYNMYFKDSFFLYNDLDPTGEKECSIVAQNNNAIPEKYKAGCDATIVDQKEWTASFKTNLNFQDSSFVNLPKDIQNRLKNLGQDMFSIKQLYIDLNSADLSKLEALNNIPVTTRGVFEKIIETYVSDTAKTHGELFLGNIVKVSNQTFSPSISFIPTDFTFYVSRFDDNGHYNPDLDTLNYLIVTENRKLPPDVPDRSKGGFNHNFVSNADQSGVLLLRSGMIQNVLNGSDMLSSLKTFCKPIKALQWTGNNIIDVQFDGNSGSIQKDVCSYKKDFPQGWQYLVIDTVSSFYAARNHMNLGIWTNWQSIANDPELPNDMDANKLWSYRFHLIAQDAHISAIRDESIIIPREGIHYSHDSRKRLSDSVTSDINNLSESVVINNTDLFIVPGNGTFKFKNPYFNTRADNQFFSIDLTYGAETQSTNTQDLFKNPNFSNQLNKEGLSIDLTYGAETQSTNTQEEL